MEYDLTKLLTPLKTDFTLVRFGRQEDGGYIVPLELCRLCNHLISFGILDDVSFEEDYIYNNPNAIIECFDGSIDYLPKNHENFKFYKKFIGANNGGDFISINELFIDQFTGMKMDIEGWEYVCLNSLLDSKFSQLQFLTVEFHLSERICPERNINDLILLLNRINQYMFPIHVHQNNTDHGYFMYNGMMVSKSIEVTFVNNIYKESKYPIKNLDYPVQIFPDVGLNWITK